MAPQPVCVVKHFEGIHTMLLAVKRTHATSVLYIAIFMISNSDCISQRRNDLTSSARAFETHNKIGISLCKRRCVDRPGCQAVQYRVKQMSCELMSVNSSQLHRVLTKGLVFTNKKSWNSVYGCSAVVCGNSSRCVMTHGGLTRHATYKCVEQGMRKKKKKSAPKGYLIYEPGKNRLFHAKRPDKSLERIHIFNSNNEYVSVTYDAGKVYFLCRDGKRLAWAQYYSHSIKLNDDCMILNGSGYGHYKWIGVDSGPGYIFASTNKRKYQLQIFKTHGDNLFPIGHINPVVDDIHMFQLYKKNREIYWVDTNLKSIHYNGSGLKNFKTIEMHNFFMDFTGTASQEPTFYGCNIFSRIILYKLPNTKLKDLGFRGTPCLGIWRLWRTTYIKNLDTRGLYRIANSRRSPRWKNQLLSETKTIVMPLASH